MLARGKALRLEPKPAFVFRAVGGIVLVVGWLVAALFAVSIFSSGW